MDHPLPRYTYALWILKKVEETMTWWGLGQVGVLCEGFLGKS